MRKAHSNIPSAAFAVLIIVSLVAACGPVTPVPTRVDSSSAELPGGQTAEQEVWLDEAVDVLQFPPTGKFVVHFKSPMSPTSSSTPVFAWPHVEGVSSWNEDRTTLTFDPASILDSKKTYTFFLDPALKYADGKSLENPAEWRIYVQSGPRIIGVTPTAGAISNLFKTIEIRFDRDMVSGDVKPALNIEPPLPFDTRWKSKRVLQINLQQPFPSEQRYTLILKNGELFAEDGSYLAEDYSWFYWQEPFDVTAKGGEKSVLISFNYSLDGKKTGLPFVISPPLSGEWTWLTPQKLLFESNEMISPGIEY